MKKLFFIGLTFALAMSACTGFADFVSGVNPFEPIPRAGTEWDYVQAKTVVYDSKGLAQPGVELCGLPAGNDKAITDQAAVFGFLRPAMQLPFDFGKSEVWIETTMSHWQVVQCRDAFGNIIPPVGAPVEEGNVLTISYNHGGNEFDISYVKKMIVFGDFNILKVNRFSGIITVTPKSEFVGLYTFIVKASGGEGGWIDINRLLTEWGYTGAFHWPYQDPCYTGFSVNFVL